MSSSSDDAAKFLEHELLTTIPLTRAMQLRVVAYDGDQVELGARKLVIGIAGPDEGIELIDVPA